MASLRFYVDLDTRKFSNDTSAFLNSISQKNKTILLYELGIKRSNVVASMPAGTTLSAAIKKTPDPPGTLLVTMTGTRQGWGTGSRWFFQIDLTDPTIGTALGTSLSISTSFEVYMTFPDGQKWASATLPFTIEKNVIVPPP